MLTPVTDLLIEELINAASGAKRDVRFRHLYEHALRGLVRAAQAEQLLAIRRDVALATGEAPLGVSVTVQCDNGATGTT